MRGDTLRRGSLTVLIASALRSCRIRLERATSRTGKGTPPAKKAFADGPAAIVRVEPGPRPDVLVKQLGVPTAEGAPWTLQAVSRHLQGLSDRKDAAAAPGAPYGPVGGRAGTRAGVTPGFEFQVQEPVMFTVSLKEAGVEKARAEAKARPGAQRI